MATKYIVDTHAEAAYIVEKRRTGIPSVRDLLDDVFGDLRIEIYPLTVGILTESRR